EPERIAAQLVDERRQQARTAHAANLPLVRTQKRSRRGAAAQGAPAPVRRAGGDLRKSAARVPPAVPSPAPPRELSGPSQGSLRRRSTRRSSGSRRVT